MIARLVGASNVGGVAIRLQNTRPRRAAGDAPLHERRLQRICGLAAVRALFERDPDRVERLFYDDSVKGEIGPLCRVLADARKPYRQVDEIELSIAGTPLHGGVAAVARRRPVAAFVPEMAEEWVKDGRRLLILDRIGNPHNLGAIVRSAAFFGLEQIILADHPAQARPSDASYRVAEGGFEYLTLYRAWLPAALDQLRRAYRRIGAAPGRRATPDRWDRSRPLALVLGNEESGLDPSTIAACDDVVAIPGSGPHSVPQCRGCGGDPDLYVDASLRPAAVGARFGDEPVENAQQRGLGFGTVDMLQQQRGGFER